MVPIDSVVLIKVVLIHSLLLLAPSHYSQDSCSPDLLCKSLIPRGPNHSLVVFIRLKIIKCCISELGTHHLQQIVL